jgi:hypothetical protein
MYPQKVISKEFFVDVLKVTNEIAGSRSESVRQRYGSVDPDPHQLVYFNLVESVSGPLIYFTNLYSLFRQLHFGLNKIGR